MFGEGGSDDIYGGHNIRHGGDTGDVISGGDMDDAVLGENGEIVRHVVSQVLYPWANSRVWRKYPSPFATEVIREIRRYDDIDYVEVSK